MNFVAVRSHGVVYLNHFNLNSLEDKKIRLYRGKVKKNHLSLSYIRFCIVSY